MVKKILITGSSGQLGSHLVEHLRDKYDIIGLDVKTSRISEVKKITVVGDIRDRDIVNDLVKKVDAIIHTASQLNIDHSLANPTLDADINIIGTLNLLDAARNNKRVFKFIYFSSSSVYGDCQYLPIDEKHPLNPVSPYGLSKLTGEKYCLLFDKIYDVPAVCIRPFNIYGDREDPGSPYASIIARFVDAVRNSKPLTIYGDGKQMRDLVHVKDGVSFIEILLERKETRREVYNLGSGKPTTILEIAKLILKAYGIKEEKNILFKEREKGKIIHSYADIEKSREIGYNPKIALEDGINDLIKFYKK